MSDENEKNGEAGDDWAEAMNEQETAASVTPDKLTEDANSTKPLDTENLDVILDIPVTLSMEVGSTRIPIRNLLQLTQGSVVELDRLAGESLDVMVNGTLIAHGEVVVINEKYGIRLTDVMSPHERIQKLK